MKKNIGRLSTIRESKVSKMELVRQEKFAGHEVDLYKDAEGNIYMTIEQLVNALEYASKSAIENMLTRNNYLKDEEFSSTHDVWVDGKLRNTRLFTEDGIYEVTMLSKQPKAHEFRFFVRELLKGLRKGELQIIQKPSYQIDDPIERAKRWIEEEEKRQQLQLENEEMKPKALFSDAVATSETSVLIGSLAKLIKQNGVDIGQNRLYEWLRQSNYLIKRKGDMYNSPTQRSMDMGLFEVKVRTIVNPDDTVTTMVTGKGQIYFVNKFVGGGNK